MAFTLGASSVPQDTGPLGLLLPEGPHTSGTLTSGTLTSGTLLATVGEKRGGACEGGYCMLKDQTRGMFS